MDKETLNDYKIWLTRLIPTVTTINPDRVHSMRTRLRMLFDHEVIDRKTYLRLHEFTLSPDFETRSIVVEIINQKEQEFLSSYNNGKTATNPDKTSDNQRVS